jgi:hypothetical protein
MRTKVLNDDNARTFAVIFEGEEGSSLPGDRGAHESFDADARWVSVQACLSRHRVALSLTAAVALASLAGARRGG